MLFVLDLIADAVLEHSVRVDFSQVVEREARKSKIQEWPYTKSMRAFCRPLREHVRHRFVRDLCVFGV